MASAHSLSRRFLALLVTLYSISNLLLFIFACKAWTKAKQRADSIHCRFLDSIECGFTRWALYTFIAAASFVCFVSTAIMSLSSWLRAKGSALDPLYIFRGVFFTLLILTPIIYLGWTGLTLNPGHHDGKPPDTRKPSAVGNVTDDLGCDATSLPPPPGADFGSLGGAFILEAADKTFGGAKAAYGLAHFNM